MSDEELRFHEGQKLKAIYWPDGHKVLVGSNGCKSITVIMEHGQVPWALVVVWDIDTYKHNLAMVRSVLLED